MAATRLPHPFCTRRSSIGSGSIAGAVGGTPFTTVMSAYWVGVPDWNQDGPNDSSTFERGLIRAERPKFFVQ